MFTLSDTLPKTKCLLGIFDASPDPVAFPILEDPMMESSASTPQSKNVPAIVVGASLLLTAGIGLFYNSATLTAALSEAFESLLQEHDLPYFYQAYYIMLGTCTLCYVVLMVCGIDLVRSRLRTSRLVTLILILEVGYFFAVGSLWLAPGIGRSIGAATGVANGGLMVQFIVFLPLWAPLLLWWARSRQKSKTDAMG